MCKCSICGCDDINNIDGDIRDELCAQADALGMESLTENQQMLVNGDICEQCYEEMD